jgi:hypothetical protein
MKSREVFGPGFDAVGVVFQSVIRRPRALSQSLVAAAVVKVLKQQKRSRKSKESRIE